VSKALLYCAGGGIGDSLVATVVARALRARYDTVDALTLPGHRATLERVPDVDAVLTDTGDEPALASHLSQRGYECSVVTWATPRTAHVPELAGIPVRIGQARRLYSNRFTHRVAVRSETGDVTSHWSDILLDYARAVGCDTPDHAPGFVPLPQDETEAHAISVSLSLAQGGYVILHPTNAIATTRPIWPVSGWAALARSLADRFGVRVLLSGAAADMPINDAIAAAAGDSRVSSIAGSAGIGAFAVLAREARVFVGITTGSMHVAAAAGAHTVGIFPFQSDFPERWAPLGRSTAIVRATYPCHRGDTKERCRDYACVAHLDTGRIVAAAQSIASDRPATLAFGS
jgi:ADP-heptose:LPS heptosyltransferase